MTLRRGRGGRTTTMPSEFHLKRLRVAVLYGGRSGEHEVSLASAAAVLANLNRKRYEPVAVRLEKDGRWVLADRPPSAASAAEVIEQTRHEATRAARRPRGSAAAAARRSDTILVLDRPAGRRRPNATAAALTGLGVDVVFPVLHGPLRRRRHDSGPARTGECRRTSAAACWRRPSAWTSCDEDACSGRAGLQRAGLGGRRSRATGWRIPAAVTRADRARH